MKKSYPTWAVPRTHTIGLDYRVVRARLGAQAVNSKLTEKQLSDRGKKLQREFMKKTTPQQRRQWSAAAGKKAAELLAERYTPEQRREFCARGGARSGATRLLTTTSEQRKAWSRAGGIKSAKVRAAKKAAARAESA